MPTPKIRLLVDFAQDGVWSTAINDITADVRRHSWSKGKKILKQRAEAATLDIIVNNEDHKYSPSNPSSPLHPYITVGPDVWLSYGYPVDTFDADDATTLTDRAPDYDALFDNWAGDTGNFVVDTNKIKPDGASNLSAYLEFEESDCWVGVDFTRNGSNSGLIVRWQDAANYLLVRNDGTTLRLTTCTAGVLADVATAGLVWGAGAEKRIQVELHGTAIRVYIDHTLYIDTTSAFGLTSTKHGIGGRAVNTSDRWDNFGGWRDVFFGRLDSVMPKPARVEQSAYLRCFDDMERMAKHVVYRTAPTAPATAENIIDEILDAADASAANRVLDAGATLTLDPAFEAILGDDALQELYQVQDDDVGFFYIDGGIYRYEGVDHRDSAPHATPLKVWHHARQSDGQSDIVFSDLAWDDNKEVIENEGYYVYYRFSLGSLAEVWALATEGIAGERDRPQIASAATLSFMTVGQGDGITEPQPPLPNVRFQVWTDEAEAGVNLTIPEDTEQGVVSATGAAAYTLDDTGQDFTAWNDGLHVVTISDNTGRFAYAWIGTADPDSDGTRVALFTGSDLATAGYAWTSDGFDEADIPLTYDVFNISAELEEGFEGNFRRVNIYNGSGSAGYITFLTMHAKEMTRTDSTAARYEDTESSTYFGRRRIEHQTRHIDRFATALDRVTERIQRRMALRIHLQPRMVNATRATLMQIIHRSISDRVTLDYPEMGLVYDGFLENQKVEVTEGGKKFDCTWGMLEDPYYRGGLGGDMFGGIGAGDGAGEGRGDAGVFGTLADTPTTEEVRVASGADDVSVEDVNGTPQFQASRGSLDFGQDQTDEVDDHALRFLNVEVPQGAYIAVAYVAFHQWSGGSGSNPKMKISGNDVDNAVAPTSLAEFNALVETTAKVDWDDWADDEDVNSASIITIIQEIVDRGSWASGNAMQLLFKDDGSAVNNYREYDAYEGEPLTAAQLHIEYY